MSSLEIPVAFLIFNRPDPTARVFERIAAARPRTLLVVADGPRPGRPGEADLCEATRSIIERVDWDCDVRTNYSDVNLGCKRRVSSGVDWVFSEVEEAIILEDDCLPDPSFFGFCSELLTHYRDDERIGMISGNNFLPSTPSHPDSYYFSRYTHIWGWASWRRAWSGYDVEMTAWPEVCCRRVLDAIFENRAAARRWEARLERVYRGLVDTWDYQWTLHCWLQNRLTILPTHNLVSNIGFGADATHTTFDSSLAQRQTRPMESLLRHPPFALRDAAADAYVERALFTPPSIPSRLRSRVGGAVQGILRVRPEGVSTCP